MATKAMSYRGGVLDADPETVEVVTGHLNNHGYITVGGQRSRDDVRGEATIIYCIINIGSRYSSKSQDFKKLLKLVAPKRTTPGNRVEIIFIYDNPDEKLFKNTDAMEEVKKLSSLNIFTYGYGYTVFKSEKPAHVMVPDHRIMSKDETKELLDKFYLTEDQLPIIRPDDEISIWLGIRSGHVVEITSASDTAGESISYRHCRSK
jgi:DNA-directed RNA polymerase subunit H (RpoH/RPB5)